MRPTPSGRPGRKSEPVPITTILRSILAKRQPAQNDQAEAAERVLTGLLPRHGARLKFVARRGKWIEVEVDSSALLHELRSFHQDAMLEALRSVAGLEDVAKLRLKLGARPHG
jgi:hypothetical protein